MVKVVLPHPEEVAATKKCDGISVDKLKSDKSRKNIAFFHKKKIEI
jgi:hypothetical protein